MTFCVASWSPALIWMVYPPGSTSGPRGPNPKPAAMASSCSGVGSAGAFERRSQFVRLTPAPPGPSISRIAFPSLSSTVIFTLPSFFSAVSPLASALGFCSAGIQPKRRKAKRSEEHTSELQSRLHLVCRLLLEKKNNNPRIYDATYIEQSRLLHRIFFYLNSCEFVTAVVRMPHHRPE